MVKIAPDKSLPQTKNRGQRLTLTHITVLAKYAQSAVFGILYLSSICTAEGSRLEAKTALRGSLLRAISHKNGRSGYSLRLDSSAGTTC